MKKPKNPNTARAKRMALGNRKSRKQTRRRTRNL